MTADSSVMGCSYRLGLSQVVAVALIAVSCGSFSRWGKADEFVGRLQCGMSRAEVAEVVDEYRGLDLREVSYSTPWEFVAIKGDTMIDLDFEDDGLQRVRVSWIDAVLHREFLPEQDLCSEESADEERSPVV